jgi:hypothetical protein
MRYDNMAAKQNVVIKGGIVAEAVPQGSIAPYVDPLGMMRNMSSNIAVLSLLSVLYNGASPFRRIWIGADYDRFVQMIMSVEDFTYENLLQLAGQGLPADFASAGEMGAEASWDMAGEMGAGGEFGAFSFPFASISRLAGNLAGKVMPKLAGVMGGVGSSMLGKAAQAVAGNVAQRVIDNPEVAIDAVSSALKRRRDPETPYAGRVSGPLPMRVSGRNEYNEDGTYQDELFDQDQYYNDEY